MNPGGLLLLALLSVVALLARRALRGDANPLVVVQRRALLALAVLLPLVGLVLPHAPWKSAAVGLLLLLVIGLELVLRAIDRHDPDADRRDGAADPKGRG